MTIKKTKKKAFGIEFPSKKILYVQQYKLVRGQSWSKTQIAILVIACLFPSLYN